MTMVGNENRQHLNKDRQETWQFRLVLFIAFGWFFMAAVGNKLMLRSAEAGCAGESCFQSAKRNAYIAVPYAFARV
jgi:hypothetical protein